MKRGLITRTVAENLMRRYGVMKLTPPSKVFRGEPPSNQEKLL